MFWDWIPDDAFISMRYAENLADGNGLVFNTGERVEGFSNPLWTLALAAAAKTGTDLEQFARWLSLLFGVALVAMSLTLFDRIAEATDAPRGISAGVFGVFAAASMPLVFYSTSGLETTAAAFFVISGVVCHIRAESERNYRRHFASNGAFLLAACLRPEGIIFLIVNGVAVVIRHRSRIPRPALMSIVGALAVFAAVVALRASYYGSPIPNTYFAKPGAGPGHWDPLVIGWFTLSHFFVVSGLVLTLPLCAIALARKSARGIALYLGAMCAAQIAFIVFVGGDVLRFDRFTVVLAPLLLGLALLGAAPLLAVGARTRTLVGAFVVLSALVAVGLNAERVRRARSKPCYHDFMHSHVHREIGVALGEMLEAGSVVVANEVGAIPHLSKLPTIDMIGLTDATVAGIVHESYKRFSTTDTTWCGDRIAEYAMAGSPALVLLPARNDLTRSSDVSADLHGIWEGIYRHKAMRTDGYRLAFIVQIGDAKFLHGYSRSDITIAHAPLDRLRELECVVVTTP